VHYYAVNLIPVFWDTIYIEKIDIFWSPAERGYRADNCSRCIR